MDSNVAGSSLGKNGLAKKMHRSKYIHTETKALNRLGKISISKKKAKIKI